MAPQVRKLLEFSAAARGGPAITMAWGGIAENFAKKFKGKRVKYAAGCK